MSTARCRLLLLIVFVAVAGRAPAAVQQPAYDQALELLSASGLETQLAYIGAGAGDQFVAQSPSLPDPIRSQLRSQLEAAYAADVLQRTALEILRAGIDDERVAPVLAWLRGDPGRRITDLEAAASTPEAMRAMQAYAETLPQQPPSAERVALLRRLDAATRSTDMSTDVALRISAAVARSMAAANPSIVEADLSRAIEQGRPRMEQAMERLTLVSFLYTYRELDDATLDAYVTFLESPDGAWYQDLAGRALAGAIDEGTKRLEASLAAPATDAAPE